LTAALSHQDARAFAALLAARAEDFDLTTRERREIAAPAEAATPNTIFRWHDDK